MEASQDLEAKEGKAKAAKVKAGEKARLPDAGIVVKTTIEDRRSVRSSARREAWKK